MNSFKPLEPELVLRGTRRTCRMIELVKESAKQCKTVFVVPFNKIDIYKRELEGYEDIIVISSEDSSIDWNTFTIKGMRNYPIFFDHYTVFRKFSTAILKYFESSFITEVKN